MCGRELKERSYIGLMMRLTRVYQLNPTQAQGNPALAQALKDNPAVAESVEKESWDLCETCQKWIWAKAVEHKEELNKTKDHE